MQYGWYDHIASTSPSQCPYAAQDRAVVLSFGFFAPTLPHLTFVHTPSCNCHHLVQATLPPPTTFLHCCLKWQNQNRATAAWFLFFLTPTHSPTLRCWMHDLPWPPPCMHHPTISPNHPSQHFPMVVLKLSPGKHGSGFLTPTCSPTLHCQTHHSPWPPPHMHHSTTFFHHLPQLFSAAHLKLCPGGCILSFRPKPAASLLNWMNCPTTTNTSHPPPSHLPQLLPTPTPNDAPVTEPWWLSFRFQISDYLYMSYK